jgi:pimeloyl-ACP methyl ester carboxylesterase
MTHQIQSAVLPAGLRLPYAEQGDPDAVPGARLVVYPGAGHSLQWEQPERVAADLAGFTASLAPIPARA